MDSSHLTSSEKTIQNDNKPRLLTNEEIADILSVLPRIKSASSEVAITNQESMLKTLREQFKEIIVTPLAIDDMKDELLRQFTDSVIKPGSSVGVNAAEALGGPITQGALNSFHQSGSSKNVSYGIARFRELINATKELKNTSCSIFFKDQSLSFDDVISKVRPSLNYITVSDIVKGIPDIESCDSLVEPWWYSPYRILIRNDFSSNRFMILDIDTNVMFTQKLTMEQVAKIIEYDLSVICVYSPLNIGKIHIYPIGKTITSNVNINENCIVDTQNASYIFLWKTVIPTLDILKLKGVSGVKQVYPIEAPVWQIVKEERKIPSIENGWHLILNEVRMKITGITVDKLVYLCKVGGMKILKERAAYISVQTPNTESPTEYIQNLLKLDKEDEKAYEKQKRDEKAMVVRRPPSDIMTASNLVYADTDGSTFKNGDSTLRTLFNNPSIDSTRTYSNNVHEINATLGIEAARTFLIKEFSDAIEYDGSYINHRHLETLIDFMVSLGNVSGVTSSGMGKQQIGALAKASLEKAMDIFKEAAGFGEKKGVSGVSASIYLGKTANIGTGYSDTFIDTSTFKDIEEEIELNPDMKIDIGAFKDAIGEMTDIVSGSSTVLMEGLEDEMFDIDEPLLPGGTIITGLLPPPYVQGTKGPVIHSGALTQAVVNLNNAKSKPCGILPVKAEEFKLGLNNLPTQINTAPLGIVPGLVPSVPISLPGLVPSVPISLPGLVPSVPISLPGLVPSVPIPILLPSKVDIPAPIVKPKMMFNLADFMK